MRRHLTYANVVATLALVFAMSGGALAAKHYLINSTKQINPKVLKKLRGNRGARGATGAPGSPGTGGARGETGPAGPSGVLGVATLTFDEANDEAINTGASWTFVGETSTQTIPGPQTAALITATMDFASGDGKKISADFGVCYQAAGGGPVTEVAAVEPEFEAKAESYFAQAVSGIVRGVAAGPYVLGACTEGESANVKHGNGGATIMLAQAG